MRKIRTIMAKTRKEGIRCINRKISPLFSHFLLFVFLLAAAFTCRSQTRSPGQSSGKQQTGWLNEPNRCQQLNFWTSLMLFSVISFYYCHFLLSALSLMIDVWLDAHATCCFLDSLVKLALFWKCKLTLKCALLSHASCVCVCVFSQDVCAVCSESSVARIMPAEWVPGLVTWNTEAATQGCSFFKLLFVSAFQQNMCDVCMKA